ncbi:hypothetical protein Tco_0375128 [Tanacetum coccineum]
MVNQVHVDYDAFLWWGFLNCVFQKRDVIQYPRFTKLIIVDLIKKFPSIPQRLEKDYHSIKDDIPLVCVYSTWNVLFRGMLIPDAFLTGEIHATDDYAGYEMVFVKKKRKQIVKETSSPKKSLKVTIKQKRKSTTKIPPPGDDLESDDMAEATLLSLILHKTALATEGKENIAKVQEKLEEEEIEKMVEGKEDEESYASEFDDSMFNDDDDSDTRIELGSHKEHPKNVVDDDDDDDEIEKEKKDDEKDDEKANDNEKKDETSSTDTMKEKTKTPIP